MTITKDEILGILDHPKEAKAWANGKQVEWRDFRSGEWTRVTSDPQFRAERFFRVKPEVHKVIRWVNIYKDGPGAYNFVTKQEAIDFAYYLQPKGVITIQVPIIWTEGEGLED